MAAIDIRYPYLIVCQISDCQTYAKTLSKMYLFDPVEILMPETICDRSNPRNLLRRAIGEKFSRLEVTPISRIHYNESIGLERIRTLCASEYSSVELFVRQKYYALAATAALLKYVEYVQRNIYAPKSMKIVLQESPDATAIDMESAESLELVLSQIGERSSSLLGVLDRCLTPMGKRLLRANILQPPCNVDVILTRQSAVAELVSNRSLRALLQPVVRRLYGADRLLALSTMQTIEGENNVHGAEQNLNYMLLLKNSLDALPELRAVLINAESAVLGNICENLGNPHFRRMKEKILETIHPDARFVIGYTSSDMQRCFAIKAGINDLLDIARQTYCELIDDMKISVEDLASKYGLPLSLGCNASLGYHVRAILPKESDADSFDPPIEFIEVRRSKRTFTMTTSALSVLSEQCKIAREELHLMSNVLLRDTLKSIRGHIDSLFQLSADVAELDTILSLAEVSCAPEYTKPTFGERLDVRNSTHPVMEALAGDHPTPNDVCASVLRNLQAITGPNMSGKSTYLKQIVLLQIMAQIGCYVPATKASFRIADRILCKLAFRDNIECNASTFTLEMKEVQYMLRSVTGTSLVVLDELCSGTTIEEGSSIAWVICERLSITTAFVFVATHFFRLTDLANFYPNVTNYHFETVSPTGPCTVSPSRLTYTHRLKRGVAPIDDYGITLSELCGLPKSLTEKARKYASDLSSGTRPIAERPTVSSRIRERTCYDLLVKLYDLLEFDRFEHENVMDLVNRFKGLRKLESGGENRRDEEPRSPKEVEGTKGKDTRSGDAETRRREWNSSLNFAAAGMVGTNTPRSVERSVEAFIPESADTISGSKNRKESSETSRFENTDGTLSKFGRNSELSVSSITPRSPSFGSQNRTYSERERAREEDMSDTSFSISNGSSWLQFAEKDKGGAFSGTSTIAGSVLSLPITPVSTTTSIFFPRSESLQTLYEYCLSEKDFRPSTYTGLTEMRETNGPAVSDRGNEIYEGALHVPRHRALRSFQPLSLDLPHGEL